MEVDDCLVKNYGEFSVTLNKNKGSLGFSLRSDPDDTTALRHSVKALVKEPAISDGRIRPGDKLISANGQECGAMSHTELISFLRSLPESGVVLKFYRDASRAQTPISTPTEGDMSRSHPNLTFLKSNSSFGKSNKPLRFEAKEMVRSLQASRNSLDGAGLSSSSLGRKLNRPFSPTVSRKGLNPLRNSSSSPFVLKQFEDTSTNEPFVETPLSPEQEKASFEYKSSPGDTNNVEIIDITDQDFSCEIETMIQDFDTVLKRSEEDEDLLESPNLERPNHLNLVGETRKDRYAFNSKIG